MTPQRPQGIGQGSPGRGDPRASARTRRATDNSAGGLQYGSEFFIGADKKLHLRVGGALRLDREQGVVVDVLAPLQVASPIRLDLEYPLMVRRDGVVSLDDRAIPAPTRVEASSGMEIEEDKEEEKTVTRERFVRGKVERVRRTQKERTIKLRAKTGSGLRVVSDAIEIAPAANVPALDLLGVLTLSDVASKLNSIITALVDAGLMEPEV